MFEESALGIFNQTMGTTARMRKADAVLMRTYGLGRAKRSQIKERRFAKAAPRRKASEPINKWEGFW
jgi:hypothetical protein